MLREDAGGVINTSTATTGQNGSVNAYAPSSTMDCDGIMCKLIIGIVCLGAGYGLAKATSGKKKKKRRSKK